MLGAMYQSSIRAQDIGNFQEQSSIEGIGMNLDRFPASLPEASGLVKLTSRGQAEVQGDGSKMICGK